MSAVPGSAPQLYFRQATVADRQRIIELVNAAYSIETFLEGSRTDDERMSAMMQKGVILVAEGKAAEDGSVELYGCVYVEVQGARGYLGQLAVAQRHQGLGLARRIVVAAEDQLRAEGCEAVDITVLNLRPELLPVYRRFGYIETGIVEDFRPTRQLAPGVQVHGIKMSKSL